MRNVNLIFKNVKSGITLIILTFVLIFLNKNVNAQSNGIYESYAILDINAGGNTYYDMNATTANPDFQGAALGSFNSANSLVVKGGQNKTFKCDGGDIFNGSLRWRVWLTSAGASGSFNTESMSFVSNDGGGCGGNQTWEGTGGVTNILSSLTTPGNYTLEVYSDADGIPGMVFSNNSGANYKATFNYCGPSAGALPAGNYAIPGCFTMASAISRINSDGVSGIGTVQFNVAAGYTETTPAGGFAITATGTPTLAIKFLKSGAGVNPTFTAFTPQVTGIAASNFDAVFKIVGGDYITIDGFTMLENGGNTVITPGTTNTMTEFGVLLVHSTAIDGAQNNTIQNNIITLNSTYSNSVGIFSTSSSSPLNAALDATTTAGTNSNNKIYGNTISNVAQGIAFICPPITSTLFETGNEIGGATAPTGNTITFGNATATSGPWNRSQSTVQAGIYYRNGAGNSIRFNFVTSSSAAYVGSGGLNGIMISSGTAPTGVTYTATISNNTVNLTTTGVALITGIDFGHGISTGTIVGSSNIVTVNQTSGGANSAVAIGIKANYASATNTCNSNTIVLNLSSSAGALSGASTGLTIAGTSTTNTANSNNITINQTGSGTGTITSVTTALSVAGAATTINALTNTILIDQTTSVATGITTGAITGIAANAIATTVNVSTTNSITIKQAVTGSGTYGANAVTYINVSAASGTINVTGNNLNTTGSTIRSTGTLIGVNQDATVTVLVNVKSNTFNVDRIAASGTSYFQFTSGTPSEVADTISSNIITFTGLAGTSIVTAINSAGGPSSPALNNKNINNNIISISGTNTGISIGINQAFTNTGFLKGNSVTISTSSPTVTAITTSSTAVTMSGNSISLTSNTISPTTMTGLAATSTTGGHSITNNTFTTMNFSGVITGSPTISGIAISGGTLANVFNNTVTSINVGAPTSSANPVVDGILVSGGVSVNVFKNKIYGITSNCTGATGVVNGIRISGGGTTSNNYYNNLIGNLTAPASTNPDGVRGISITSTTATTTNSVYYNTIYLSGGGGTNFGSSGIFHTASATPTTATLNLRNNIIVNATTPNGSGFAVSLRRSGVALNNYASTSNNNDFYAGATTSSPYFIYYDGTGYQIDGYKTLVSTKDNFSFSEDPEFQSITGSSADFLKYTVVSAKQLESGGNSSGISITDDYIGTMRGVTPDIGAWELAGIALDLYGPSISYTLLTNSLCDLDRTLAAVTIMDPSNVNTTAGTKPRLYFKKSTDTDTYAGNTSGDNGWKYVEASNSASPFSFTTNFSLLQAAVVGGDVIQYFVVAQDVAVTPNVSINSGSFAATPTSVALTSAAFPLTGTVNSYTVIAGGLMGTVNVGPGETYTTLSGAGGLFAALNSGGLKGDLIAIITGNITEDGANALNAINYGCAGSYLLTIKPNVSVSPVLSGTNATALINFNGADLVTIDGSNNGTSTKDLTIRNTSTAGNTFRFINDATGNIIKNTIVEGGNTSATSGTILFSTTTFTLGNSSNIINNCDIRDRSDAAGVPANAVYSSGTASAPNASNTISGCNVFNFTNAGVLVSSTGAGNGWTVNPSSFYQTAARTTALTGISFQGGSGHSILNNSIGGTAPLASGANLSTSSTFRGIDLIVGTLSATNVQGNTVKNIRSTSTSFAASYGIYLQAGMANIGNITGNTIGSSNATERIEINGDSYGIRITSSSTVNLSNNVINNMTTGPTVPTGEYYFGISVEGPGGIHSVVNNTVINFTNSSTPDGTFNTQTIGIIVQATGIQTVRGNVIHDVGCTSTAVPTTFNNRIWGMIISATPIGTVVEKNLIYNIYGSSTATGARADVVSLLQAQSLANGTYSNNMISGSDLSGSSDRSIFGILDLTLAPSVNNYYFNTVNIYGTATTTNNTYAFNRNGTATVNIKNNIFSNGRAGGSGYHVAIANTNSVATGWSSTASDYNDLYSADPSTLAQWLGSAAINNMNFAGWKAAQVAGSGGDANSINILPVFTSATDLHLTSANPELDNAGTPIAGITSDIDNDTRNITIPDIGTDEFKSCATVTSTADAGVGTLRAAIACVQENGKVYYDQPTTTSTILTALLTIDKSVTIFGGGPLSRPEITTDPNTGISIDVTKTLTLKDVDVKSTAPAQTFSGAGTVSITGTTVGKQ